MFRKQKNKCIGCAFTAHSRMMLFALLVGITRGGPPLGWRALLVRAAVSLGEQFQMFGSIVRAFIFRMEQLACFTLKTKPLFSSETSDTSHPTTQRHVPEDLNSRLLGIFPISS
jgi:hypothetical protein